MNSAGGSSVVSWYQSSDNWRMVIMKVLTSSICSLFSKSLLFCLCRYLSPSHVPPPCQSVVEVFFSFSVTKLYPEASLQTNDAVSSVRFVHTEFFLEWSVCWPCRIFVCFHQGGGKVLEDVLRRLVLQMADRLVKLPVLDSASFLAYVTRYRNTISFPSGKNVRTTYDSGSHCSLRISFVLMKIDIDV